MNEEDECEAVKLARIHVQLREIGGLRNRFISFNYHTEFNPDSEDFTESATEYVRESRRMFIKPNDERK